MNGWQLVLIGWLALALVMALLWLWQRRTGNAGIVDVAWSLGTAAMGVWFAWGAEGDATRRWLVGAIAALWGLRLGLHLGQRMARETEDGRYAALRQKWGDHTQRNLLIFFQVQAAWAVMFAAPMYAAASSARPAPAWHDWAGLALWVIALGGETLADRQLARFRADPSRRGQVCDRGLWRYSRHPNYFFEWLHWWAYVLIGWGGGLWWITWLGPAVMLLFLLKVTGVPPTEARALLSRGDAYRAYQRRTSVFFPWPPRRQEV